MSQVQLYTKAQVYVSSGNGNFSGLLTQYADVKVTRNSGLLPVNTAYQGFAGFTPGAPFLEIEIGNAVPNADFEWNPGTDESVGEPGIAPQAIIPVTLSIVAAGRTLTSDGCIMSDDFSYAINSEAKLNIRFHGEWADWQ